MSKTKKPKAEAVTPPADNVTPAEAVAEVKTASETENSAPTGGGDPAPILPVDPPPVAVQPETVTVTDGTKAPDAATDLFAAASARKPKVTDEFDPNKRGPGRPVGSSGAKPGPKGKTPKVTANVDEAIDAAASRVANVSMFLFALIGGSEGFLPQTTSKQTDQDQAAIKIALANSYKANGVPNVSPKAEIVTAYGGYLFNRMSDPKTRKQVVKRGKAVVKFVKSTINQVRGVEPAPPVKRVKPQPKPEEAAPLVP